MQQICNCQQFHEQKRNGSRNMTQQESIHSQQQSNFQSTGNENQQRTNIMTPNQSVINCHNEPSKQSCTTLSGGMQRSGNVYSLTNSPYYDFYQASQIPSTYASMVDSTHQTGMHEQMDIDSSIPITPGQKSHYEHRYNQYSDIADAGAEDELYSLSELSLPDINNLFKTPSSGKHNA